MDIHDLKRSQVEGSTLLGSDMPRERQPEYGYGTVLSLESPEVAKLGIGGVSVGDVLSIQGSAKVTGMMDEEGNKSVTLQVTHLGTEAPNAEQSNDATVLYPQAAVNGD